MGWSFAEAAPVGDRATAKFFNLAADVYGWLNSQGTWRAHCERLAESVPQGPATVVDLGCGPGVSAFALAQLRPSAKVVGIDYSSRMISQARRRAERLGGRARDVSFLQADAAALPFPDRSVDVLTGHSFLYLIQDRERVLSEAMRVLVPGGRLVLLEPHEGPVRWGQVVRSAQQRRHVLAMVLWRRFSRVYGRFSSEQLSALLERSGFSVEQTEVSLDGMGLLIRARRPPDGV